MKKLIIILLLLGSTNLFSQNNLTPEMLWKLGRVAPLGLTKDKQSVVYAVSIPDIQENKSKKKYYSIPVTGGNATEISDPESLLSNDRISPDGKFIISSKEVQVIRTRSSDIYTDLPKSNAYVLQALGYLGGRKI